MKKGVTTHVIIIIAAIIIAVALIAFGIHIITKGKISMNPILGNTSKAANDVGQQISSLDQ